MIFQSNKEYMRYSLDPLNFLPPPINVQQFAARFEICWLWASEYLKTYFLGNHLTSAAVEAVEFSLGITREYGVIFKASINKLDPSRIDLDWQAELDNKGLEEYINSAKGREEVNLYFSAQFYPIPEFNYDIGEKLYRRKGFGLATVEIKNRSRKSSTSVYSVKEGNYLVSKQEWELDGYSKDRESILREIEEELIEDENDLKRARELFNEEKKK